MMPTLQGLRNAIAGRSSQGHARTDVDGAADEVSKLKLQGKNDAPTTDITDSKLFAQDFELWSAKATITHLLFKAIQDQGLQSNKVAPKLVLAHLIARYEGRVAEPNALAVDVDFQQSKLYRSFQGTPRYNAPAFEAQVGSLIAKICAELFIDKPAELSGASSSRSPNFNPKVPIFPVAEAPSPESWRTVPDVSPEASSVSGYQSSNISSLETYQPPFSSQPRSSPSAATTTSYSPSFPSGVSSLGSGSSRPSVGTSVSGSSVVSKQRNPSQGSRQDVSVAPQCQDCGSETYRRKTDPRKTNGNANRLYFSCAACPFWNGWCRDGWGEQYPQATPDDHRNRICHCNEPCKGRITGWNAQPLPRAFQYICANMTTEHPGCGYTFYPA